MSSASPSASAVAPESPRSFKERAGAPFKQLQKIGKAFTLPIAILPAAGLLFGVGGALPNPTTVAASLARSSRACSSASR